MRAGAKTEEQQEAREQFQENFKGVYNVIQEHEEEQAVQQDAMLAMGENNAYEEGSMSDCDEEEKSEEVQTKSSGGGFMSMLGFGGKKKEKKAANKRVIKSSAMPVQPSSISMSNQV